jgi:uncharacterized protein with GYD domain
VRDINRQDQISSASLHLGVVVVAKYLVLFGLTGETMKPFVAKPSDRAAVVRELAEFGGGSLESYYWMFGQYDGVGVWSRRSANPALRLLPWHGRPGRSFHRSASLSSASGYQRSSRRRTGN